MFRSMFWVITLYMDDNDVLVLKTRAKVGVHQFVYGGSLLVDLYSSPKIFILEKHKVQLNAQCHGHAIRKLVLHKSEDSPIVFY